MRLGPCRNCPENLRYIVHVNVVVYDDQVLDEAPRIGEHTQDGAVVVRSRTRRHRLQVPRSDGKMRSAADGISVSVFGGLVLALSTVERLPRTEPPAMITIQIKL